MKTFIIASVSIILIMAMGMTTEKEYTEYDELIVETDHLTDSARIYLEELTHTNDSLLDVYFPVEDGTK